jgi:hypothetical protein
MLVRSILLFISRCQKSTRSHRKSSVNSAILHSNISGSRSSTIRQIKADQNAPIVRSTDSNEIEMLINQNESIILGDRELPVDCGGVGGNGGNNVSRIMNINFSIQNAMKNHYAYLASNLSEQRSDSN